MIVFCSINRSVDLMTNKIYKNFSDANNIYIFQIKVKSLKFEFYNLSVIYISESGKSDCFLVVINNVQIALTINKTPANVIAERASLLRKCFII
jgi:hypothetical protein